MMRTHPYRDKVGPAPVKATVKPLKDNGRDTVEISVEVPEEGEVRAAVKAAMEAPEEAAVNTLPTPVVLVQVDWNTIPMDQARTLYAELKSHFEKAGAILNNRSMPREPYYICFMCKTRHEGDPRGKDYARKDPRSGLLMPVAICGERCWIEYQDMCIKERKATEMLKELGYDQEMSRQLFDRYERNLEGLINELGQRIMKARAGT